MSTLRDALNATDADEVAKAKALDEIDRKLAIDYKAVVAGIEAYGVESIVDYQARKMYTIDASNLKGYVITEPPGIDDAPPPLVVPPVIAPVVPVPPLSFMPTPAQDAAHALSPIVGEAPGNATIHRDGSTIAPDGTVLVPPTR